MKSIKFISKHIYIIFFMLFGINGIFAQKYSVDNGKAFFKAKMTFNSYTGISNDLRGHFDFETGLMEFRVPVKSIKTEISKRDLDMYELLKEKENPEVIFKGKMIDKFNPDLKTNQTISVKGSFTLAGVTRDVTIPITLNQEESGIHLTASWSLLITDYNLKRPVKAFLKVNDEHELGVDFLLIKQ